MNLDQRSFYDDIAEYYDLIYADWEGSMRRHGDAIAAMLGDPDPSTCRVLDVSAGIGTQALPLAAMGYRVVARDLSPNAVARLRREAQARGLTLDAEAADMREVGASVAGRFDAVVAFDNSVPHLLTDEDIRAAFSQLAAVLAPGGSILLSVRDYDSVDRAPISFHEYGERARNGRRFRMSQEWRWRSPTHYRTTMRVEEAVGDAWTERVRTEAEYYAIPIERILELMRDAGLVASRVVDVPFFQPVLRGVAG